MPISENTSLTTGATVSRTNYKKLALCALALTAFAAVATMKMFDPTTGDSAYRTRTVSAEDTGLDDNKKFGMSWSNKGDDDDDDKVDEKKCRARCPIKHCNSRKDACKPACADCTKCHVTPTADQVKGVPAAMVARVVAKITAGVACMCGKVDKKTFMFATDAAEKKAGKECGMHDDRDEDEKCDDNKRKCFASGDTRAIQEANEKVCEGHGFTEASCPKTGQCHMGYDNDDGDKNGGKDNGKDRQVDEDKCRAVCPIKHCNNEKDACKTVCFKCLACHAGSEARAKDYLAHKCKASGADDKSAAEDAGKAADAADRAEDDKKKAQAAAKASAEAYAQKKNAQMAADKKAAHDAAMKAKEYAEKALAEKKNAQMAADKKAAHDAAMKAKDYAAKADADKAEKALAEKAKALNVAGGGKGVAAVAAVAAAAKDFKVADKCTAKCPDTCTHPCHAARKECAACAACHVDQGEVTKEELAQINGLIAKVGDGKKCEEIMHKMMQDPCEKAHDKAACYKVMAATRSSAQAKP